MKSISFARAVLLLGFVLSTLPGSAAADVTVRGYAIGSSVHITAEFSAPTRGLNLAFANAVSWQGPADVVAPVGAGVTTVFLGFNATLPGPPGPLTSYSTGFGPLVQARGTTALGPDTLQVYAHAGNTESALATAGQEVYLGQLNLTGDVVATPTLWMPDAVCDLAGPCHHTGPDEVTFELLDPNGTPIAVPMSALPSSWLVILALVLLFASFAYRSPRGDREAIALRG